MWFDSLLQKSVRPPRGLHRSRRGHLPLALEGLEDRSVPSSFATVMSGLDNPRGLAFGPDGSLYVAEAGRGGSGPIAEIRLGTVGAYGSSGAVSRLCQGGQARVVTGLPSYITPAAATGPHDIAFDDSGNAYVTIGFGGDPARRAGFGQAGAGFAQLVRLDPEGGRQNVADLGGYEAAFNPDGGPIDTNPYGLLGEADGRVVTDAGGNSLLRVGADGEVSTLGIFPSRSTGRSTDAVPTCVVAGPDGAYYVGELSGVPFAPGAANIYRVVPGETPVVAYSGLTSVIGLSFGPDGSLYVLEYATGPGLSGDGAVVRIAPDGTRTPVEVPGLRLTNPTGVLVAEDGAIYVSNRGSSVGTGEVLRITLGPAEVERVVVDDGTAQRSMVRSLTVTFDRVVALDAGAFEVHRQDGSPVDLRVSTSVSGGRTVAVLSFAGPGIIGGSLADGNYTLTIHGDRIHDGDGTELDGDGDGVAGGDRTDAFFRLFGDTDGNRTVDLLDLERFLSTFGHRRGDPQYLDYLDFNGDGRVGLIDLFAFLGRLGTHLGP